MSTWFRDDVYAPLGGNRVGPARRRLNLLLTFLVSGVWHGAAWNFVLWGALYGATMVISSVLWPRSRQSMPKRPGGDENVPSVGTVGPERQNLRDRLRLLRADTTKERLDPGSLRSLIECCAE